MRNRGVVPPAVLKRGKFAPFWVFFFWSEWSAWLRAACRYRADKAICNVKRSKYIPARLRRTQPGLTRLFLPVSPSSSFLHHSNALSMPLCESRNTGWPFPTAPLYSTRRGYRSQSQERGQRKDGDGGEKRRRRAGDKGLRYTREQRGEMRGD